MKAFIPLEGRRCGENSIFSLSWLSTKQSTSLLSWNRLTRLPKVISSAVNPSNSSSDSVSRKMSGIESLLSSSVNAKRSVAMISIHDESINSDTSINTDTTKHTNLCSLSIYHSFTGFLRGTCERYE